MIALLITCTALLIYSVIAERRLAQAYRHINKLRERLKKEGISDD